MSEFSWRRIHSLLGLWIVFYLIFHLVVNSQASLWIGSDSNFVRLVNSLESMPFLHVIEIVFIGIPLLVHGYWGILRALKAKTNALPYERNKAFTWQRLTAWLLLFAIVFHVGQMRFFSMPKESAHGFSVRLSQDDAIQQIAKQMDVEISEQEGALVAVAKTPGQAILLMVRETFKSFWMAVFYSLFVLAAAFHAFNGVWTSLITWGVLLSYQSQRAFLPICYLCAAMLAFLGLCAIWGSYFLARSL